MKPSLTIFIAIGMLLPPVAESGTHGSGPGPRLNDGGSVQRQYDGGRPGRHSLRRQAGNNRNRKVTASHRRLGAPGAGRISWREPGYSVCIGSGCARHRRGRIRRPNSSWRPRPRHRRFSYFHYGTRVRCYEPEPVTVVLEPPQAPAPVQPVYKTIRTWIPPEKKRVWVPARKQCGIRSQWMGDHWRFETDPDNCELVPGRMEEYVAREGYFQEEVVRID